MKLGLTLLASADRRPVDPPPVVQLTVVDENAGEDITMAYDAGFMLYTSLELARPIAHGRMHTATQLPVLTGVAVASTAYLERPQKAGYFIFPDLSVRHEGWYRLKFSLFEAVKHPEDADLGRPFDLSANDSSRDVIAHQCMANRMEVQSSPFQVFSAKKFPGLGCSTEISQLVADQGCKVRIRRDIRQRKRNTEEKLDGDRPTSRTSPAPSFDQPEHHRSASRSSIDYYNDRVRQHSMDYSRPTPSRQLSIASMTQPSPKIASSSQMTPMAPPPAKYETSPMYSPVTRPTDVRYITQMPLPPILPVPGQSSARSQSIPLNPWSRQYEIPEKPTVKRSYSPTSYDDRSSMKAGSRPDQRPQPSFGPVSGTDAIEPDDNPDDDETAYDAPYLYVRADGGFDRKNDPRERGWMQLPRMQM